jgi:dipeptidyl-peptidase 4
MRRFWTKVALLPLVLASPVWAGSVMAQDAPAKAAQNGQSLTLERVFASPDLNGPAPRGLQLAPDGKSVTILKNREDNRERYDLWTIDVATGAQRMLVDSEKLGSGAELSEAEKMQRERQRIGSLKGITTYSWTPDGKAILVPLDGDLFLARPDGSAAKIALDKGAKLNPTVSPKGGFISYVGDQNLIVHNLATNNTQKLTQDGGGLIHWGEAEFVAQEEMDRLTGHWWSPDDSHIAVARVDETPVGVVTRAAIGANGTAVYDQRYPAAGTPNALVDLYVMRADGSGRVKVDLGSNPDIYLARVNWSPDGKALYVQRQDRGQKRIDLLQVDPATGASKLLLSEEQPKWTNLHEAFRALDDGSFLWSSERTGFAHLYRWKAGKFTALTSGKWIVKDVIRVDQTAGQVYFIGNADTPLENHVYRVALKGGGKPVRLSESGYWNGASMRGDTMIVSRSSPTQPTQTYLADKTGKRLSWISENRVEGSHPYAPFMASHRRPEFGTIKAADGSDLYYKILTPEMVAGQKYPVFIQHYGGPGAGRQVTRAWGSALQQYLLRQGWIVFSIDGRGSPDRGKAFEDQIYRAMGTVEVADQVAGAKWLKTQDFVDPERMAIYGWSYGGYMTLKLLQAAPGLYAAGVSGAPVTKWELYDTHYTERYMGMPGKQVADGDAYTRSGAIAESAKIVDPMLLIHGMADDNVVLDNSTALMSAMQGRGQPFEVMLYPGQTHSVGGPKIGVHLWKTILEFLDREVKNKKPN